MTGLAGRLPLARGNADALDSTRNAGKARYTPCQANSRATNLCPGDARNMRLIRRFNIPATESQLALALGLCAVTMALMLWMIVWQSGVIAYQQEVIRWMWSWKFGG